MKTNIPRPLLDRFLGASGGPDNLTAYADAVLRDVEALLNTRAVSVFGGDEEDLGYGLPDLTLAGRGDGELDRLAWRVRSCLDRYEPRLTNIRVEALPPAPGEIERLTVRITAALAGYERRPDLNMEMPLPVGASGA